MFVFKGHDYFSLTIIQSQVNTSCGTVALNIIFSYHWLKKRPPRVTAPQLNSTHFLRKWLQEMFTFSQLQSKFHVNK